MKLTVIMLLFVFSFFFSSCSSDDDDYYKRDQQVNKIEYKVFSNTPDVPIRISEFPGGTLVIKNSWKGEYETKQYGASMTLSCEDENVLMTGEIYVNGKLKLREEGNRSVYLMVSGIK